MTSIATDLPTMLALMVPVLMATAASRMTRPMVMISALDVASLGKRPFYWRCSTV